MKLEKIFILPIVLSSILFSSCGDDFLEGTQSDNLNGTDLNQVAPKAGTGSLVGAYTQLFNTDLQASHEDFSIRAIYFANDAMTDDMAIPNGFYFNSDYQNSNRDAISLRTKSTWGQLYQIIFAANKALAIFNRVEEKDQTDKIKEAIAESKTLRAYCYYLLINLFQQPYSTNKNAPGIPIVTDTERKFGRNTVSQVYDFILADLKESYDILKGKGVTSENKINEYITAAILAKVLCFVNDYPNQWGEVARYADIALQGKPLTIDPLNDLTYGYNAISSKAEIMWGSLIDNETNTYYASFMSSMDPFQIGYAGMGRFICISSELFNELQKNSTDVRLNWFASTDLPEASGTGKTIIKYTALKFKDRGGFTSDYIYMRYPEMHYLKAEALYLAGDESGARSALEVVSKTRISGYSASTKSGNDLLNEIRIQKRIETWGEGVRLFDMKWRGEALDRTGSTNHVQTYTLKLPANPKEWVYQIPQAEIDSNNELTDQSQNP